MGELDETVDIHNNMYETPWKKCASFHGKMFV